MRILLLPLFLCALFLAGCLSPAEESGSPDGVVASPAETLVSDGAWCWFSDPRAIYHHGDHEKLYFGSINSRGDVQISSRDMTTDELESFILHDSLEIDDHNVPAILILPDGELLAFYNEHNGNVFMRRSVHPEDITAWEPERIICRPTDEYNYTYVNPVQLSEENGRIYLIGRKVGPTRSFEHWWPYYKYSDDEGATWSEDIVLLHNEGRKNPPYLKVATDHRSRIDFLFTDGHPKIGPDVSVYHMYYQQDSFYQTNGQPITRRDQLPIAIQSVNPVYDAAPSNVRAWIWDIALTNGAPVITYARYPSEDDHIYHYAYWENDRWVDHKLVNSGSMITVLRQGDVVREAHYSGGVVLDHGDPRQVYLSREVNGKFEIEHWQLLEDGRWFVALVTEGSAKDNVRPYVAYRSPSGQSLLLWMYGVYRHYTNYDVEIRLKEIN